MQAASRTPGDGTECNFCCTTQHQHKSPTSNVNNSTDYAELGNGKVITCGAYNHIITNSIKTQCSGTSEQGTCWEQYKFTCFVLCGEVVLL